MDVHLQDIPFLFFVVLGVFLPEIYSRIRWSFRLLAFIRLLTLIAACILAVVANRIMYPHADSAVMFTRAFIFVSFCRVILITSHLQADRKPVVVEEK